MAGEEGQVLTLEYVLDDLCCRFLLNLPKSEFESFERLFFAIESAHWFYEDFFREQDKGLPKYSLKDFATALFEHTPLLQPYRENVDKLLQAFTHYKQEVPKCGAAMLNPSMDKVLLVLGWGQRGRWGFPKGKLGNDETELECAIREVEEETGYNFSDLARENEYLDLTQQNVRTRIYVVPDVPEETMFEPKTRKEIAKIEWHIINALPEDFSDKRAGKYGSLVMFVRRLKNWVRNHQKGGRSENNGKHNRSLSESRKTPSKRKQMREEDMRAASTTRKGKGKPRRDAVTFGTPDTTLNDNDRERLFTKYLEESELRRQDMDTREYDMIVDSITFGNSGAEEIARRLEMDAPDEAVDPEIERTSRVSDKSQTFFAFPTDSFKFDEQGILSCFTVPVK